MQNAFTASAIYKIATMSEKNLHLANDWLHIDPHKIQKTLLENSRLFRHGRPITEKEFEVLTSSAQIEYAKIRKVLTLDEAKLQVAEYMVLVSPIRKPIFFTLLSEGILYSIDHGIGYYRNPKDADNASLTSEERLFYRRFLSSEDKFVAYNHLGIGEVLARSSDATTLEQMLGRDVYIATRLAIYKIQPHKSPEHALYRETNVTVQPLLRQSASVNSARSHCSGCGKEAARLSAGESLNVEGLCPVCSVDKRTENIRSKTSKMFSPSLKDVLEKCMLLENQWSKVRNG